MAWREQLQPASFRGVPFYVYTSSGEVGRRNVVHEYPLRDTPMVEDLGRAKRTFIVEAVVVGADYMDQRDALITALEEFGSGELIHPWRGVQQVCLTAPARVSESSDEGGCAKFSMEFTESGENELPAARVDSVAMLDVAASDVLDVAKSDFMSSWSLAGASSLLDDAMGSVDGMMKMADGVLGPIQDGMAQLDKLSNTLQTIVSAPGKIFDQALSSLERIQGRLLNPLAGASLLNVGSLNRAKALFGRNQGNTSVPQNAAARASGSPPVSSPNAVQSALAQVMPLMTSTPPRPAIQPLTPADKTMLSNRQSLDRLQQTIAVTQAALALPAAPVAAQADLIAVRAQLFTVIDTLLDTASDAQYPTLLRLKTAAQQVVAERLPLARALKTVTVQQTTSALVLAYRANGSLDAVDDLLARNGVRHPGFIHDGRKIELIKPAL